MVYRQGYPRLALVFALLGALGAAPMAAAEPSLHIDLDTQNSASQQVVADLAGRYLFTCSADDTVRVFEALGGAPVRTLRLPHGTAGGTPTIAVSPDGQLLAIAQHGDPADSAAGGTIAVLRWRQGKVLRRWHELSSGIPSLAFSRDGERLAVARTQAGISVYAVQTGEELGRDAEYPGPCAGLDFAQDGRLATSSEDGSLRLYDKGLKLLRRIELKVSAESNLQTVRFSPDGKKLALAYRGSPQVELYSADDLTLLYRPRTTGVDNGDLRLLAWSRSGASLYAAGTWRRGDGYQIRRWSGGGQAGFEDLPAAASAVTALAPLPQEGLAFAVQGAGWGVLTASGRRAYYRPRQTPVYLADKLRVDRTGSRVRFSLVPPEGSGNAVLVAAFSVLDHTLTADPPADPRVPDDPPAPPPARPPDGAVTAIASRDGRVVVAARQDGTICWYTAEGRLLLTLLPHVDRKRWIAWTPSGYYDTSVGGENLLGWQAERGVDRVADFFPIGLFRERLYRPDVIAKILFTQDEQQALTAADAEAQREQTAVPITRMLPPVVTILDPVDGAQAKSSTLTVHVAVRSPSGEPVRAVRALLQGRLVQTREVRDLVVVQPQPPIQELDPGAVVYALPVTLPAEDCTLAILAETTMSKSEAALLHLRWAGEATARAATPLPDLFVLAVGTSNYRQARLRLEYPAKDAADLAAALKAQEGKRYRRVELRVLTNERATRGSILEGLAWLRQKTTPTDSAVFFLAGHGINESSDGKYYYLPYDAEMGAAADTMVDAGQIQVFLSSIRGKVLLFIDTCHSGNVLGPQRGQGGLDVNRVVTELASVDNGVVVYAASTGGQVSHESPRWGNGAFTKAVVEGLRGKADYSRSGRITVSSLEHYISNRVKELTLEEQTPTTAKPSTVPDFLIASVPPPPPLYRNPRFWAILSTSVAIAAVISTALTVTLQYKPPMSDGGAFMVTFPGVN